eukprot:GEMP01074312.1.p1 GENE.GEMP01074312.1~~GEMP01074312.1.p1  ORF type:complete len:229 (+),score=39.40 GEMP01074312.1:117-803(+)
MIEIQYDNPVLVALAVGLVSFAIFLLVTRHTQLPGTVKKEGTFDLEDAEEKSQMEERRRDFLRCAKAMSGILVSVDGDITPLYTKQVDDYDAALKVLENWLGTNNLKISPEKLVPYLAVAPGFSFLMTHSIPPMTRQDKYTILAGDDQVRVLWSCYITDSPQPDQVAGPFILILMSEDLIAKDPNSTVTTFSYSVRPSSTKNMIKSLERKGTFLAKAARGCKVSFSKL